MNLNRLHEFVVITRKKSIKDAAGELYVSPSTLGIRLHNFEQSLGITLFQKDHLPLELTKEGEFFYKDTAHIVKEYLDCNYSEPLYPKTISGFPFKASRIAVKALIPCLCAVPI
jgi:hypothetical protein